MWRLILFFLCIGAEGSPALQPTTLADQVVVVTGASGDIGLEIAKRCVEAGACVVAHYHRNPGRLEDLRKRYPDRIQLISADFTNFKKAEKLWHQAVSWKKRVDVLINAAGIEKQAKALSDAYPVAAETMSINYFGPMIMCNHAVAYFNEARVQGVIINIGSRAAFRGMPQGYYHYSDSKAALTLYTQQLARDQADKGITAVVIAPGPVEGQMFHQLDPEVREKCLESMPTKKPVTIEEVVNAVMFYATRQAPSGTGGVLDLMGASWFH